MRGDSWTVSFFLCWSKHFDCSAVEMWGEFKHRYIKIKYIICTSFKRSLQMLFFIGNTWISYDLHCQLKQRHAVKSLRIRLCVFIPIWTVLKSLITEMQIQAESRIPPILRRWKTIIWSTVCVTHVMHVWWQQWQWKANPVFVCVCVRS